MLLLLFWMRRLGYGILCYHGYKPAAGSSVGGALKAGLQLSREEEGGTWELDPVAVLDQF